MATASRRLDEEIERQIDAKVVEYGYADASSYVRDLIRRDEAREDDLRTEIQKGLDSGISPFTLEEAIEAGFENARRKCV